MKNVTITLEDETALWTRVWAAKQNTSVSRLLGEVLKSRMKQEKGYELAMRQYLSVPLKPLKQSSESYPDRNSLHER